MDERESRKDEAIKRAQNLANNSEDQGSQEHVGNRIANTLQQIPVSKDKFQKYQCTLADRLIEKWKEEATVKVFRGVELDKYSKFLDQFQKSTGIDT